MFRIGQKVVCVDDSPFPQNDEPVPLVLNRIYTVSFVRERPGFMSSAELGLAEQPGFGPDGPSSDKGFRSSRFRPVVEKKTDAGMAILQEILRRETVDDRAPARVHD